MILSLFVAWAATAQPAPASNVEGVVRDAAGIAVAGARVSLGASDSSVDALTGPDGRFALPWEAGAGWLVVEAEGFARVRQRLEPDTDRSPLVIVLRRAFADEVLVILLRPDASGEGRAAASCSQARIPAPAPAARSAA